MTPGTATARRLRTMDGARQGTSAPRFGKGQEAVHACPLSLDDPPSRLLLLDPMVRRVIHTAHSATYYTHYTHVLEHFASSRRRDGRR